MFARQARDRCGTTMLLSLIPLVGLLFRGATLCEHDDLVPGSASLGRPTFTPGQLLANLELRLGLPDPGVLDAVRLQIWCQRLADVAARGPRFFSASFATDPVGTGRTLLAWRDGLVDAGWNGAPVDGGGARLDVMAEIEDGMELPLGIVDRLRRVEEHLGCARAAVFAAIDLAEPRAAWSVRWNSVFGQLERLGTPVRSTERALPGATDGSDLARVQSALRGAAVGEGAALRGDGTFLRLTGETSWELARGVAALLETNRDSRTVVIRPDDARALDLALASQGLATQGVSDASPWRPALQVLPLAVELLFEPRDPYRVLELVTLPVGPFRGSPGRTLARALAAAPGVGGPKWREAKEKIAVQERESALARAKGDGLSGAQATTAADDAVQRRMDRIRAWLEPPVFDPNAGAPRNEVLAVADRVRAWLQGNVVRASDAARAKPDDADLGNRARLLGAALAQAQAFHMAVSVDPRDPIGLVEARQLLEEVSRGGAGAQLTDEIAGRVDGVGAPASLRTTRDVVVWWSCVGGGRRVPTSPWRAAEVEALRAAGVRPVDPAESLAAETRSWRDALLSARHRIVLAVPRTARGEAQESHPIWDELVARMGAGDDEIARITFDVRDVLAGRVPRLGETSPRIAELEALRLPEARTSWRLPEGTLTAAASHSASSLDALVGCPLRWVLSYGAGMRGGSSAAIPSGPLLAGQLGHRVVEELHAVGALGDRAATVREIGAILERLVREEAAVLLRPGRSFDRVQLERQIHRAAVSLSELLAKAKLEVVGVEVRSEAKWRTGLLGGRIDVLLRTEDGGEVILDMKWGKSAYRDLLAAGMATQLAVYSAARCIQTGAKDLPPAAYFSLQSGDLVTLTVDAAVFAAPSHIEGRSMAETWERLERTVELIEKKLRRGEVTVTGASGSLPLLDALDVPEAKQDRYLAPAGGAACKYCNYGALCGVTWEGLV
jgi:RecB family exonuclease